MPEVKSERETAARGCGSRYCHSGTVRMRFWEELQRLKDHNPASPARPFVTAAFAMSRDGYLTKTRGQATRLSGPESMRVTHQLRAVHDALMVGVGTVLSDDPLLTTRLVAGPSPLRIVLDSQLRVPATARLLRSTAQRPWLVTSWQAPPQRAAALEAAGADLLRVKQSREGVALTEMLSGLYARGVRSLMLEGGAAVLESFFRAQCVDYLVLTVSPERLANPLAVSLGCCTAEALRGWHGSDIATLGDDRLEVGPWQSDRSRLRSTSAGLT
jgi:3,4-dihydroxy 2-butanone 4-phosphate synthase/GTP cyclohydrolase II